MNPMPGHQPAATRQNMIINSLSKKIPQMLDLGANIIAIHLQDNMMIFPTHNPLKVS